MLNKPIRLSYLLRLWPVQENSQTVWRASLENPKTGERLGFPSLVRLFFFLEDQTATLAEEAGSTLAGKERHDKPMQDHQP